MAAASSPELRLSAVRAFLGAIRPEVRRISVTEAERTIRISVVVADPCPLDDIREDVSVAATEIVADFDDRRIAEHVVVDNGRLSAAHIIDDGLIYQRWEAA